MVKIKREKTWLFILVIVVLLFVAYYYGVFDNVFEIKSSNHTGNPIDNPIIPNAICENDLGLSDFEIFSALEILAGKSLNYAEVSPYIDALHMKVYACDSYDAVTLLEQFEAEYATEGWTASGRAPQPSSSWTAYHEYWTQTTNARSVTTAEGAAVTSTFNHDTVYLLAYGPATTYYQFAAVVFT